MRHFGPGTDPAAMRATGFLLAGAQPGRAAPASSKSAWAQDASALRTSTTTNTPPKLRPNTRAKRLSLASMGARLIILFCGEDPGGAGVLLDWSRAALLADDRQLLLGLRAHLVGLVADHDDLGVGRPGLDDAAGAAGAFAHDEEVRESRRGERSRRDGDRQQLHSHFNVLSGVIGRSENRLWKISFRHAGRKNNAVRRGAGHRCTVEMFVADGRKRGRLREPRLVMSSA